MRSTFLSASAARLPQLCAFPLPSIAHVSGVTYAAAAAAALSCARAYAYLGDSGEPFENILLSAQ